MEEWYKPQPLPKKDQKDEPPKNQLDATVQLARFRPARADVEALRVLLEARADANIINGPGDISPLRNVIVFARNCDVARMRELLLEHGASENATDRQSWLQRQYSDEHDAAWVRNFHRDDREG